MKSLYFINLIKTFLRALIKFTFTGGIGLLGIIFILVRIFGVIHWAWWIVALPLEYGVIYCLYMTFDGAKYRAGLNDAGAYARSTSPFSKQESKNLQIQTIINEGPDYIGETIDGLCSVKSRMEFNQALLDASLERYGLRQLALLGNKDSKANDTIKKWRESGLKLPEERTSVFYPNENKI